MKILTKRDLQSKIGSKASNKLLAGNKSLKSDQEAINKVCKDFLSSNGMEPLLRKIELKFPNSCFFPISSAGKKSMLSKVLLISPELLSSGCVIILNPLRARRKFQSSLKK